MCILSLLMVCVTFLFVDEPPAKNGAPQRPVPNEEFRAAYVEIATPLMELRKQWVEAKDEQLKDKIMKDMIATMAKRLLPLVRKYPDSRESFSFLLQCAGAGHLEGTELLFQLHDQKADLGDGCLNLALQAVPMGDRLCQTVFEKTKNPDNRARACLGLGIWLKKDGDAAVEAGKLDQAKKQYALAELHLLRCVKEFGDIKFDFGPILGKPTIKVLAERSLYEIKHLSVGQVAPELTGIDLEGKPLSLKDYQGKVVMVSFWAHWCGPCMAFVPHERELAERYTNKPFALLGVNGDEMSKELLDKTKKANITWRSLQNQARESEPKHSEKWNVITWPTVYLIDAQGIIRKKWIGRVDPKMLDEAVETLVKQIEKGPK